MSLLCPMAGGTVAAQKADVPDPAGATAKLIAQADSLRALALALSGGDAEGERRAITLLRAEIAIQQRLNRLKEVGAAWNFAGHAFSALQQYDSAEVVYRRALAARLEAGDRHGVAASTNNIGNVFRQTDRPDSAVAYYERAVSLAREAEAEPLEASLLTNLAMGYSDQAARDRRKLDSALAALHAALAIHRRLGERAEPGSFRRTLTNLGHHHNYVRRADSALFYWRAALELASRDGDRGAESELLYSIGALYDRTDMLDSARAYFVRAATAAGLGGDAGARADAEYRIGDLHTQRGQSDSAVAYYRSALRLARSVGDSGRVGDFLNAIGRDARLSGRLDTAAHYIRAALAVYRADGNREGQARALDGLARYFEQSGRRDSAVVMFGEALAVRRELGDTSAQVHTLLALANTLTPIIPRESQMIRDSSRKAFAEALRLADARGDASLRAAVNFALASHYQYWRQSDSARAHATAALDVFRATGDVLEQARTLRWIAQAHTSPDSVAVYVEDALALARRVEAPSVEMDIHLGAGQHYSRLAARDSSNQSLRERSYAHLRDAVVLARETDQPGAQASALQSVGYLHATASPRRWADAAAYFDSAWVVLENMRQGAGDDAARIAFADRNVNAARLLMWAWGERAKETGEQGDLRRALAARERGRSRALLDMMGREADGALAGSLDTVAASLIRAVARPEIATLLYNVGQVTSVDVILPSGRIETFEIPVSADTATARIHALRGALGVEAAAARTAPELLEPVAPGATRDLLGGKPPGSITTEEQLAANLDLVTDYALPQSLRDLLDRERIKELVIITDGPTALIPFAALPYDSVGQPLGERMTLRFSPSLALVAGGTGNRARGQPGAPSIVVGNPSMPTVAAAKGPVQLNPLPGAEEEARLVAVALGALALTGEQATETVVREALATAAVVHLATHGYAYASEHRVRDSFVALAPGGGEDGLLTMGELIDEVGTITADLVVLSACQTALGTTTRAEGTVGLQRAFLAKGARSLLVSLWSVDDAVTKTLMVRFYHHWLDGKTKAEALRLAQADVRRTHPNPRYWAAFQLVGAE